MRGGPACAVRPLLARGRLVTVDSHPVCADCGVAVAPGAAGRWKHVPAGQPYPRRSRWFATVTWAALREVRSYQEFTERFPWTVRSELCGGAVTSEGDWSEGMRRLREYHGLLAAARRHDAASYAALRAYRGDSFIYAGGALGGPTGTVRFHRELELNWHPAEQAALPNWPGLRDRLVVYRRNPVRRPLSRRDRCQGCRRFLPTGAIGRCDACFARNPPAMALLVNGQRVEYPREVVDAMPRGLRLAFERSPALIPVSPRD